MAKSTSTRSYYGDGLSDFSNVVTATINSIDGAWSDWSAWSECPYCDGSLRVRYRNCTNPTPKFDGLPCEGPVEDRMLCNHTAFCMGKSMMLALGGFLGNYKAIHGLMPPFEATHG